MHLNKPPLGTSLDWSNQMNDGLLMHLAMTEGHGDIVHDLSMNGNHGTLNNFAFPPTTTSGWNPGRAGVALVFDGAGDYVDIGDMPVDGTDLTISAWVYVHDVVADQRSIVTKYGGADALRAFIFGVDTDGSMRFYTIDGVATKRKKTAVGVISVNTWHHVVVVYNETANDADIYVDTILKPNSQNDDVLNKIQNVATHVVIGGRAAGGDDMDGIVDEVRIQNRAMTAKEIKDYHINPWQVYLD